MVDHRDIASQESLDGANLTVQLTFLKTLPPAPFDQLLHVVHHVSSTTRHVAAQRRDERRPMLVGLGGKCVFDVLRHSLESDGTVQLPH